MRRNRPPPKPKMTKLRQATALGPVGARVLRGWGTVNHRVPFGVGLGGVMGNDGMIAQMTLDRLHWVVHRRRWDRRAGRRSSPRSTIVYRTSIPSSTLPLHPSTTCSPAAFLRTCSRKTSGTPLQDIDHGHSGMRPKWRHTLLRVASHDLYSRDGVLFLLVADHRGVRCQDSHGCASD